MSVVAKRYAEAYLSFARDHDALDRVGEDISNLIGLIEVSEELADFFTNPLISSEDQSSCLKSLFEGTLHEVSYKFLILLVQKERLAELEDILSMARQFWRDLQGVLPVSVTSAEEFTGDQRQALEKKLAERTGKTIEPTYSIQSDLIGGFQLSFQGVVEDYSLAAVLQTFKQNVLNA